MSRREEGEVRKMSESESEGDLLRVADHGAVRVLELNRPASRNAMSTALVGRLLDAVGEAAAAEAVRAIVLTGAEGHFSAGADVKEPLDEAGLARRLELFGELSEAVATCPTPTIAAVHGACVGGGFETAAATDIRVADPSARFRVAGAAMGYPIGAAKLVGLVGLGTAKELALAGRTVDADEAARLGLVQRLAEPGGAREAGVALGEEVAAHEPGVVAALKRQFAAFSGLGDRVAVENDAVRALVEAGGDPRALTASDPRSVGGFAAGNWVPR
jgi:enoyl-CoA hydratase/carnithine racemase